jgi:ubiquinone/menaquinone biosynthesis C-methylase UbiE
MLSEHLESEVASAWSTLARWWADEMKLVDPVHKHLIYPALDSLLELRPGERVLEVGAGSGELARHLTAQGGEVVAVDLVPGLLDIARGRSEGLSIDYRVIDCTSEADLAQLESQSFAAIVASMVFHNMSDIRPFTSQVARLLQPSGRFVVAMPHPCFNEDRVVKFRERVLSNDWRYVHGVRITEYARSYETIGKAKRDQPNGVPHFHRSLSEMLGGCLSSGLVVDAFLEPVPSPTLVGEEHEKWALDLEVPQFAFFRCRRATAGRDNP